MCKSRCNQCTQCTPNCTCTSISYDPCAKDSTCKQKIDASCVVYKFNDINGLSQLTNLNLPTGTTLEQFMIAVDRALGCL